MTLRDFDTPHTRFTPTPFFIRPLVFVFLISLVMILWACLSPRVRNRAHPEAQSQEAPTLSPNTAPETPVTFDDVQVEYAGGELLVRARRLEGEALEAFGARLLADPGNWRSLQMKSSLAASEWLEVPFELLSGVYRGLALRKAFTEDVLTENGWQHVVTFNGETLWFIARFFTGKGENFRAIMEHNKLASGSSIRRGQRLLIPTPLLTADIATGFTVAVPPDSSERITTPSKQLTTDIQKLFSRDPELSFIAIAGENFGSYRLKRGEALYTSVVIRFTGRVDAADVIATAKELMALNGIRDETTIPAGKEIRIPLRLLDESLLSERPPERQRPYSPVSRGKNLHVILDAGHGGNDPGTIVNGWREDRIAYDIMRRVQIGLEKRRVTVHPIISPSRDFTTATNGVVKKNEVHKYVNVTPPYFLEDSRIGVNLRICLVDHLYDDLRRRGVQPEDILFLSIHLDHLHPSVRGAMVYFPGAEQRASSYRTSLAVYARHEESRGRTIDFPSSHSRRAEQYSYIFAQEVISSFQQHNVPIHAYKPIRNYVYRGGYKWTPGIIRYSRVPTSVLLEVANLANTNDLKNAMSEAFRQRLADAVVQAIVSSP